MRYPHPLPPLPNTSGRREGSRCAPVLPPLSISHPNARLTTGARLVDMPGYGFAFAPTDAPGAWQAAMREYVQVTSTHAMPAPKCQWPAAACILPHRDSLALTRRRGRTFSQVTQPTDTSPPLRTSIPQARWPLRDANLILRRVGTSAPLPHTCLLTRLSASARCSSSFYAHHPSASHALRLSPPGPPPAFQSRGSSLRVLVCIDARQSLRALDRDFLLMLEKESRVPYLVVMTKCDLVKSEELAKR